MVVNKAVKREIVSSRFKHLVVNCYVEDEENIVADRHIVLHAGHTVLHPTQSLGVIARLGNSGMVKTCEQLLCTFTSFLGLI